jgi:hypothetical protein
VSFIRPGRARICQCSGRDYTRGTLVCTCVRARKLRVRSTRETGLGQSPRRNSFALRRLRQSLRSSRLGKMEVDRPPRAATLLCCDCTSGRASFLVLSQERRDETDEKA